MTETHFSSTNQIAHPVPLDTPHPNAVVIDAVATFRPPSDQRAQQGEEHDVFTVVSAGSDGADIARTVYAANEDDARQTHQENYPDEPIVAVHQ